MGAERTIKVNAPWWPRPTVISVRGSRRYIREDFYFRLGGFIILVPPLRDRREDIPALVHDFVRRAAVRVKNRELEHAIERAVIVARDATIRVRELPPEISQKTRLLTTEYSLDLQAQEQLVIGRALYRVRGNRREAAKARKISTVTLWRKMKAYGLAG